MPYAPNELVENFTVFNGGTAGTTVSPGQYALDWIRALGGNITTEGVNSNEIIITMPQLGDGTPAPIPDALAALITNARNSVVAAVAGKVYPAGSDQPPMPSKSYYP